MDKNRADEIMRAPTKIEVVYNGEPVWIEGVDDTGAIVKVMGTSKTFDVSFSELTETGKYEMHLNR